MSSSIREQLQIALSDFATRPLREAATALLSTLGYESSRVLRFDSLEELPNTVTLEDVKVNIKSFCGLFQLTSDEVRSSGQTRLFNAGRFENSIVESYVFVALELTKTENTRTELAKITRALNKSFKIPVFVIFKHGNTISLSVTRRRLNKRDEGKDVLEKVTIIKDIGLEKPHQAHLRILEELHLPTLLAGKVITEFVELERMWVKVLDIEELNKKFYKELSQWFYWAFDHANTSFPNEKTAKTEKDRDEIRQINLIRLITRLIFTWFLKEKSLVPDELFEPNKLKNILKNFEKLEETSSTYYQSILQNLFFATLNTEMGKDEKGANHRRFKDDTQTRNNTGYMVHNLYRYQSSFVEPSQAVRLFGSVPFLNGGLFECLDREKNTETNEKELRIDGFSDKLEKRAVVPNALFFTNELNADLSKHLGPKFKNAKVRGILEILNGYKFTVTENTPIEEEVALDPELLGKVFENLLAAYNPETEETARKQTGSFYTPRDVVDFMVDESLIAYLHHALTGGQIVVNGVNAGEPAPMLMPENDPNLLLTPNVQAGDKDHLEERLHRLFSYTTEYKPEFSSDQITKLITAIDTAKILDPACGSGAFPMGVLQKLVFVLGRLDPNNKRWKEQQRERSIGERILEIKQDLETAQKFNDSEIRDQAVKSLKDRLQEIERAFDASTTDFDYARKLFLIENCIYGVDIQPIAVQIAKLRCFISLVIDQKVDDLKDNRGILPLPNLETKFVAANSLMPLSEEPTLFLPKEIDDLENELKIIRHEHFRAKNFQKKKVLRNKDTQVRQAIARLLEVESHAKISAQRMAAFDPYNQNSSAPFFDPHWMFGNTAFDVVIGNPPYGVKFSKEEKQALLKIYKHQDYQLDSYLLFLEGAFDLAKKNTGIVSYIIPNTWLINIKQNKIRKFIFSNQSILSISKYDRRLFNAVVDTEVIISRARKPEKNHIFITRNIKIDSEIVNFLAVNELLAFNGDTVNLYIDLEKRNLAKLVESSGVALKSICDISTGVKSYQVDKGTPKQTRENVKNRIFDSKEKKDSTYLPLLRGSDIGRYFIRWNPNYIKYGIHLAEPRKPQNFNKKEKIVLRQTGDKLIATLDTQQFICMDNLYVINQVDNYWGCPR